MLKELPFFPVENKSVLLENNKGSSISPRPVAINDILHIVLHGSPPTGNEYGLLSNAGKNYRIYTYKYTYFKSNQSP